MEASKIQLSKFVDMKNPQKVLEEVKKIVLMIFPQFDFGQVDQVFHDVIKLFRGEYPGYKGCNTEYHDSKHTTDALMAMIRLIHGGVLRGETFSQKNVNMGLITTFLHDAGYIETLDESGTGAKFTLVHIQRSIEFLHRYFKGENFSREDFKNCSDMLRCTGLNVKIHEIKFSSRETELLGKMLGTADLLGQMADRTYLEKLLFLFYEFREGHVGTYTSELDMLKKTLSFYDITKERLATELGGVNKYMIFHFKKRWNIDMDLYKETMKRNRDYLKYIVENHEKKYRNYLRRGGYVKKLHEKGL